MPLRGAGTCTERAPNLQAGRLRICIGEVGSITLLCTQLDSLWTCFATCNDYDIHTSPALPSGQLTACLPQAAMRSTSPSHANSSRATGEPLGVAATRTAQTNLRVVSLRAAATHRHPQHTALHHWALLQFLLLPLHLHLPRVWLKMSLPTRRTKHQSTRRLCSSAKRTQASSLVVTS